MLSSERYKATAHLTVADPRTLVGVFGGQVPGVAVTSSEIEALAEAPAHREARHRERS